MTDVPNPAPTTGEPSAQASESQSRTCISRVVGAVIVPFVPTDAGAPQADGHPAAPEA